MVKMAKPKMSSMETQTEGHEEKHKSAKAETHAENLRKVQALRKEKSLSLADAWKLFKK
jgi:hypothetical protein